MFGLDEWIAGISDEGSIVVVVLVLRRLPEYFTDRPLQRNRYWRMALGAAVAAVVTGFMLLSTNARTADPVSQDFAEESVEFGGGYNIVNVTLVDIRAWDTMGELAVLVAAATGVASLIFIDTRGSSIRRVYDIPYPASVRKLPTTESNVVAYTVVAEADNPGDKLLPGMTANADIILDRRPDALRVPNAALSPIPSGATCDQCGAEASGQPIATALTDANGHFVMENVPTGTNIPLVIQVGKWRRQVTIPSVASST